MRKFVLGLTALLLLSTPMISHASGLMLGGGGNSGGSSGDSVTTSGPEGGIEGEFSGSVDEDGNISGELSGEITFPYQAYTPKVTRLHSVNAMFADAGYAIYFLPLLEDFPSDLSTLALDTVSTVDNTRHQFAIVYDGDYDREVMYEQAVSTGPKVTHYVTSKKVYSANNNSRSLNLLGYDFLLQSERYDIQVIENSSGGYELWANYIPMVISDRQPIMAKTAVMDIYKALGIYEWDIQFAFTRQNAARYGTFDINKHPIVTQLPALTGLNGSQGVDISELETYVAVTRTNPDLYWKRAQRDCLFTGSSPYVSKDEVGVTGITGLHMASTASVSYIDFLTLCANMMYLYGEPVLTASEAKNVLNALQITIPASCSQEQVAALSFLVAKGVIGTDELDGLNNWLEYSKMLTILMRVADRSSRLSFKYEMGYMASLGYIEVPNISVVEDVQHYSFESTDYYNKLDYLVEKVDDVTAYYVQSRPTDTPSSSVTVSTVQTDSSDLRFNASELLFEDKDYYSYWTGDRWLSIIHGGSTSIEWLNDVTIDGKDFYHFRIDKNAFPGGITLGLAVNPVAGENYMLAEGLPDITEVYPHTSMNPYTLAPGGGIYLMKGGSLVRYAFDSVPLSDGSYKIDTTLLDDTRAAQFSGAAHLSGGIVMDIFIVRGNKSPSELAVVTEDDGTYNYRAVCNSTGFQEGTGFEICPGKMYANVINHMDDGYWQIEVQTNTTQTSIRPTKHNPFGGDADIKDLGGFYRAADRTLLVSLQELIDKGIVSFYSSFTNGYVLTLAETKTTVTLYQSEERKYAYIGETLLMLPQDETLYELVGESIYVSYKACTGWASDYVTVYDKDYVTLYTSSAASVKHTKKLNLPYASYNDTTLSVSYPDGLPSDKPAVDMMANNPMSNYILVQQADASYNDVLFVVRVSESTSGYGSTAIGNCRGISRHYSGEEAQRLFAQVTRGLDYTPPQYCELHAYTLTSGTDYSAGSDSDIICNSVDLPELSTQYGKSEPIRRVTGYLYYMHTPANHVTQSIAAYYGSVSKRLIPLSASSANSWTYTNINLNRVKVDSITPMEKAGTYVRDFRVLANPNEIQMVAMDRDSDRRITRLARLNGTGGIIAVTSAGELGDEYTIIPAPTGCFAQLRGLHYISASNIGSTSLTDVFFYGSVPVTKSRDNAHWSGANVDVDLSTIDWYCVYYNPFGSIYAAVTSDFGQVTASYKKSYDSLQNSIGDKIASFDWNKYTLGRMVEGMDRWSSVVLIAILNILPRVGVFLFLMLILLASAAHTKLMVRFCHSTFDIYSFLTLKHMTVDTCDTKRLLLTSIFAIAIFSMIMDGFIIRIVAFTCNVFVELIHR